MHGSEPVRRRSEIEDVTNLLLIHPVANRLTVLLARLHVRPNAVSVAGMLCGIAAGVAYFHSRNSTFAIAGFALMIAWHVMDGADGQLARLTRRQSESGKVLDGICDYVTFIAVYIGLALQLSGQHRGWTWAVVIAAGACHAVQSAAYEVQRQDYEHFGWDRAATRQAPSRSGSRAFGLMYRLYAGVQSRFGTRFHRKLEEVLSERPERAGVIRGRYRQTFAQPVRRWAILSANYRTVGIFLCALLKVPVLYFCFEITGFSLILAVLMHRQRVRQARFLATLGLEEAL